MIKQMILLSTFLLVGGVAWAQTDYTGRVAVDQSVKKSGSNVVVHMDMELDSLELGAQHSLLITPVLQSKDKSMEKELAPVMINGSIRDKVYRRSVALYDQPEIAQTVIRRKNGEPQQIAYDASVPYEQWMRNANLILRESVEGCAACGLGEDERPLGVVLPYKKPVLPAFATAFVQPASEDVKRREENVELHIRYIVNKSDIVLGLGDNRAELQKVKDMVNRINENKDYTITGFRIKGYASPEGTQKSNQSLSERRSRSMADYIRRMYGWDAALFHTEGGGEDWDGLVKALQASDVATKEQVLAIINEEPDFDARDGKIRAIDAGKTYNQLLKTLYPPLRRSYCQVDFEVRNYTPEEAKEFLYSNPKMLSVKEIYQVAATYPEGSAERSEAYLIAHRTFPQNEAAAVNAASVLTAQGKTTEARNILDGIPQSGAVYHAIGMTYIQDKNYEQALDAFNKGTQAGHAGARTNAEALTKYLEEVKQNEY